VNQDTIVKRFERFLRSRSLKLTAQRRRIFDRAFGTHEHFSAERLYTWLRAEPGPRVSRATVYRTISLLMEGHFIEALDRGRGRGRGDIVYEHVLGHPHHDHMVCLDCGKIEEFHDERIEALQIEACSKKSFQLVRHDLRLHGYCRSCARRRARRSTDATTATAGDSES
jgi:Fur family ferric uptake transcriptional regulator